MAKKLGTLGAQTAPLLVDAAGAAQLLSLGRTSFFGLVAAGRVPRAVFRHGRIVRWDAQELRAWVRAGCPNRDTWETGRRQQ